jgi:hypothetical protein
MLVAPCVVFKINQGSKSHFAFLLMAFTFFDGSYQFSMFFINGFRHSYVVAGKTHHSVNMYADLAATYCYNLVSLQSWIFGMKYLQSAMFCSLTPPCISS